MKKLIMICVFALIFSLCACQSRGDFEELGSLSTPAESTSEETTMAETTAPQERVNASVYRDALQRFYSQSILPDGSIYQPEEGFGDLSENRFAIADIDDDGTAELILSITAAPMAGQQELVYRCDGGSFAEIFMAFPAITYYTQGLIWVEASHNHSMSMELWPYTLYAWEEAAGSYEQIAYVAGWSKELSPTDWNGNPYPEAVDTAGVGTVHLVEQGGSTHTLSQADYESWLAETLAGAQKLEVSYQSLTQENINKVAE